MKDLSYYKNLKYKTVLLELDESDGGGFEAWIEEFGKSTCVGSGDTKIEALESLNEIKEWVIEGWYREGRQIPEPLNKEYTTEERNI